MPVVYCDTAVSFRSHASDNNWRQAIFTVTEIESGHHLLMISGAYQGPAAQHDLRWQDLLVALIHNAWIIDMDEVRFRSSESLWTAAEELLKHRRARSVRAEQAKNLCLVLAKSLVESSQQSCDPGVLTDPIPTLSTIIAAIRLQSA
ncbi:hypothetical protein BC629DRAFT_1442961 [Irpex lacteus]|nr:hypothetical protein BC629DRAFT_1442961 [Irpex lacteus]